MTVLDVGRGFHSPPRATNQPAIKTTRAAFAGASLADLYDPVAMPPELRKAHQALDRAVDAAYCAAETGAKRKNLFATDADRVAFLFKLYHEYTTPLELPETPAPKRRKRK